MSGLTLYPAIDLKEGKAVRLRRGDMADATIYSDVPAAVAKDFAAAGCRWIHVVDLDGAFAGRAVNSAAVRAILAAVSVPVQLGGGIRDMAAITGWLEAGVSRVILGSAAVKAPDLVRAACRLFPGQVAVAIDARDGRVAAEGWAETTEIAAAELALRFEDAGAAALIYTDIGRDGMLAGLDLERTIALARSVSTPVIASGGVGSMADLERLKEKAEGSLAGVIVGRALYDGRLGIAEALAALGP
ncbi:MAG TPA: 1-(5-phosphoribosyl)-5-[(5-phosphoribosylamino)methylideneamino]imidazole-4-carboxamide isomerase [Acetobacteraceae bacterium]|jgi:phosphoribosylformimino-5-aminoimidazole carboxamide ribotide isomerase|nr:1-(5-phosphoribosyl)-5-[(5-phosphoribosylamino)methylideneamino]imidazole-4-carboxamide isomerase [Acetobacteraceae bacterium]